MLTKAQELLKKYYGYPSFKKPQEEMIASILSGNDTFGILPTGGGKSLCYQIPALLFEGITLVISPLISLMKDQVDTLNSLGIKATYLNSSLSSLELNQRVQEALGGSFKIIYIAPERLESERFKQLIRKLHISFVAIDEAHCISQWGHDFRPSYREIPAFVAQLPQKPIVAAFTATATENVIREIIHLLSLQHGNSFINSIKRDNLTFSVIKEEKQNEFIVEYLRKNPQKAGIIYAATRKAVDELYSFLKGKGFHVGKYHGGLEEQERDSYQERFIYDEVDTLIATNAFGMGVDKSNVRYVIHYNIPKNIEAYYQEAGRAGRDGQASDCLLLFQPRDVQTQKFLIEQSFSDEQKEQDYKRLQVLVNYCHTQECLRNHIIEYFGQQEEDSCGLCSNCLSDGERVDITLHAQKIVSCIVRMKERFGTVLVAKVLKGSKDKRIAQFNFDSLSTYGILKDVSEKQITEMIQFLISAGYLDLSDGQYPLVKVNHKSKAILSGEEKVFMRQTAMAKEKHKLEGRKQQHSAIEYNEDLFNELRELRRELARRDKVAPFIIFSDVSLLEMCQYLPTDKASMLRVKGVGELKFEKYGHLFIEPITRYVSTDNQTIIPSK